MAKRLMKRQVPSSLERYWTADFFSRAWGSGLVRQLLRRYLGVPGLRFRLRPRLALGSIDGVVTVPDGSTESLGAAAGGSTVAVGDGSTAGAWVDGLTADSPLLPDTVCAPRDV